jgi:hypothetical protein
VPIIDDRGSEELIKKLKFDLDQAYRKIDDLMSKKNVQIIERPKIIEKMVPVEKKGFTEGDADLVEQLQNIADKQYHDRLKRYLYTIWRQEYLLRKLTDESNEAKGALKAKPIQVREERIDPSLLVIGDKIVDLFNYMRVRIVEEIFELFVRSANHAYQKKV